MKQRCKNCSKLFKTYPSRVKIGKGQFCSLQCYEKYTTKKHCVEKVCRMCGKKWMHPKTQAGDRFCSSVCYRKFLKLRPNIIYGIRTCLRCGKEFQTLNARMKTSKGKYCSKECYAESMRLPKEVIRQHQNARVRKYRKEHNSWYLSIKLISFRILTF